MPALPTRKYIQNQTYFQLQEIRKYKGINLSTLPKSYVAIPLKFSLRTLKMTGINEETSLAIK